MTLIKRILESWGERVAMKIRKNLMTGILMVVILVVSMAAPGLAAGESSSQSLLIDGNITMDVNYGYDNGAKGGRYIPVRVMLRNTVETPFDGQLQVLSMESDYDIYRYDYPVWIEGGSSTEKVMDIPLGNQMDQLFVNLVDNAGNRVIHKRIKLNVNQEVPELFVGILSDTPEKLQYLNGVGVNYSLLRTRTFSLDETNFPVDEISMNLIDVIVISNYKIRNLSARQSQTLIEWVRGGGIMILGTGARVDDTLGRFAPELLDKSYDPPQIRRIDMGQDYAADGPGDSVLEIPTADFSLSGANIIFADDQITLVSSVAYAKGVIAVAAYDFVDIEEFSQRNPSYVDMLLTGVLGQNKINRLAENSYSGNSVMYWSANNMINTGNVNRLPNIPWYILEIIIYIVLVGPGLYIFLKQRELRKYYRTGVVLLSLAFTVIIYLMGGKTRFKDTFYTYARFVDTSEDSVKESTYLNIQAPYSTSVDVSLEQGYSVKPITRGYYEESYNIPSFTGDEDNKITIQYASDKTKISLRDMMAFEPKYFLLDKVEENINGFGFMGELFMDEGKVTGSITNSFYGSVEDATVLLYDKMILLGDMEQGETKSLDGLEVVQYPQADYNEIAEKITGSDQYGQPDINDKEYMNAFARTNLLIAYLDHSSTAYTPNARVVGVISQTDYNPLSTSMSSVEGLTVVSSTLNVYPSKDGVTYRSVLMKKPNVISGSYDSMKNSLYGIDPVVLEYSLGNDVQVEKLFFDYVSPSFTDTVKASALIPFEGSIYFYNHDNGTYDKMNKSQGMYTKEELVPYLSPGNTITVKYVYSNASGYSFDVLLPMLNIVGGEY